jgi:LTXXQ motif family protein
MRLVLPIAGGLLLLMTVPTQAPALKLGRVLESIAVGHFLRHPRRAYRPYAYRSRTRRAYAQAPQYRTAQQQAQMAQGSEAQMRQAMQYPTVQAGAFWPSAPQDVFDYILLSKEAAFWMDSSGAFVVSMFARPPAKISQRGSAELAATDEVQSTTGAAASERAERICGEHSASGIDAVTEQLRGPITPVADQESSLTALRDALLKADEEIAAACPDVIPSALPERLKAMQDRLWTMRATTTNLRAPLQAFHDSLTNEQKAKLDPPQPSERESRSGAPGNEPAMLCYAAAQRAPQWPLDQLARAVRPNKDQQVSLRTLGELSGQMGQLMMASCPRQKPATPSARLDVVVDRLDTMFFATVNLTAALNDFYQSLSDEQKAKLDRLSL